MERPMENKEKTMLKMRQMSIEEKIAMLSDKDEAYIRGFIEGTIYWIHQTAQRKGNGSGNANGKAAAAAIIKAKPKTQKTSQKTGKNNQL